MTNLEVAKCYISNALAYAKAGEMKTVIINLKYIEKLLEKPHKKNKDHTWGDFR